MDAASNQHCVYNLYLSGFNRRDQEEENGGGIDRAAPRLAEFKEKQVGDGVGSQSQRIACCFSK
jgi:hypothetical protein